MQEAVESSEYVEASETNPPARNRSDSRKNIQPEKVVRRGAIAASIWKRQSTSGFVYYDFSLSRAWKSRSGEKQGYSGNFFDNNAMDLIEVIGEAAIWIEQQGTTGQNPSPMVADSE